MEIWLRAVLKRTGDGAADGLVERGLDRETLLGMSIPEHIIERLYRAFYVYSVGFMELLDEVFVHCEQRKVLIANIWTTFVAVSYNAKMRLYMSLLYIPKVSSVCRCR